jgi:YD repeat-containing protein
MYVTPFFGQNEVNVFAYTYDNDDNITGISDALTPANNVSYGYDAVGRLTQVTTVSGTARRTDFQFDANGNRTAKLTRALPDDPESAAAVESYVSDARSNQLDGITGAGGSRSFVYDGRGNLSSETRPGGVTVNTGYDGPSTMLRTGHGRLTSYASSGNASLSHQYNGLDDRIATTTISGTASDTRRFVYDPDGRVIGGAAGVAGQQYGASAADIKAERIWMNPIVGNSGSLGGYMPLGQFPPCNSTINGPAIKGTTESASLKSLRASDSPTITTSLA